jgi:hypothetical protein
MLENPGDVVDIDVANHDFGQLFLNEKMPRYAAGGTPKVEKARSRQTRSRVHFSYLDVIAKTGQPIFKMTVAIISFAISRGRDRKSIAFHTREYAGRVSEFREPHFLNLASDEVLRNPYG